MVTRWFAAFALLLRSADGFAAWLKCFVDLDETEIIMNHQVLLPEDAPHHLQLEASWDGQDWTTNSLVYAEPRKAFLRLPAEQLPDLQYVIEASEGGLFAHSSMCEGRRTHVANNRARDSYATVQLDIDNQQASVTVWAGWAVGHSSVSLTPAYVFRRQQSGAEEEAEL